MNKRLIIIFVCLAVFVLTVVLGAVVFTVSDIQVLAAGDNDSEFDKAKIVTDSGIKHKISIFTVNEKKAIENIEKNNPYVKVISIERVFPNKVHINISKRIGILAMELSDGNNYAIIDRELKILEIIAKNDINLYEYTLINGYILKSENTDTLAGNFLSLDVLQIKNLYDTVQGMENVGFVNERFTAFTYSIDMSDPKYIVYYTRKGIKLAARTNTNVEIKEQIRTLYSKFDSLSDEDKCADVFIFIDESGVKYDNKLP